MLIFRKTTQSATNSTQIPLLKLEMNINLPLEQSNCSCHIETNTQKFSRISERLTTSLRTFSIAEVFGGGPSPISSGCTTATPQQCLKELLFIGPCCIHAVDRYFGIWCRRWNESVNVLQSRSNRLGVVYILQMLYSIIAISLSQCKSSEHTLSFIHSLQNLYSSGALPTPAQIRRTVLRRERNIGEKVSTVNYSGMHAYIWLLVKCLLIISQGHLKWKSKRSNGVYLHLHQDHHARCLHTRSQMLETPWDGPQLKL